MIKSAASLHPKCLSIISADKIKELAIEMQDRLGTFTGHLSGVGKQLDRSVSSYNKAVAVWCADDRNSALTDAKQGKAVEMKSCANPISRHMELVRQLGARGTPFIVLEDGGTQPGYVPAKQLARLLNQPAAR